MMRPYEFTMIVRPDLDEVDTSAVLSRYEEKIAVDGRIVRRDVWGTKRFAYPVKKFFRGYYVCYDIVASPTVVKDLEHQIRFDNRVLRHIIIGVTEHEEPAIDEVADEGTSTEPATDTDNAVTKEATDDKEQQSTEDNIDQEVSQPVVDDSDDDVVATEQSAVSNDDATETVDDETDKVTVEPTSDKETVDEVSESIETTSDDEQT